MIANELKIPLNDLPSNNSIVTIDIEKQEIIIDKKKWDEMEARRMKNSSYRMWKLYHRLL